jgi:hypothetical protein
MKKKKSQKQTHDYLGFLEKALKSENFKNNDPEKYAKTKEKYEREKLLRKLKIESL